MCCVIKLQLNLNQSVIRFNRPTNTESSAAPTHYIYSTYTQYTCLLKYCRPPTSAGLSVFGENLLQ